MKILESNEYSSRKKLKNLESNAYSLRKKWKFFSRMNILQENFRVRWTFFKKKLKILESNEHSSRKKWKFFSRMNLLQVKNENFLVEWILFFHYNHYLIWDFTLIILM